MSELSEAGFQVPEHVRQYLRDLGYVLLLDPMDEHSRVWDDWACTRAYSPRGSSTRDVPSISSRCMCVSFQKV